MPLTGAPSSCRARFTDADALAALRSLRPPEVRRVVELKQSMIVKAGDAVVNPVCCLKARRRTYMLNDLRVGS